VASQNKRRQATTSEERERQLAALAYDSPRNNYVMELSPLKFRCTSQGCFS